MLHILAVYGYINPFQWLILSSSHLISSIQSPETKSYGLDRR